MEIELQKVSDSEKGILANLLQLCMHDYTELEPFEIGSDGRFHYRWFDAYFEEECRYAYLLKVENNLGGFVLVRKNPDKEDWDYQIAEFFILRRYRNQGIGTTVANKTLERFEGLWEISYSVANKPALKFWKKVSEHYSNVEHQTHFDGNDRSRYLIHTAK